MENKTVISDGAEATFALGAELAEALKPGDIVCMYGELGAGKTVFVQGLAKGLGVDDYISSPTFNIVNTYAGRLTLNHFDAYRIADCDEMLDIGFDEYINGDGVCVIEWAELIEDIIPDGAYRVTIERTFEGDDDIRRISIAIR